MKNEALDINAGVREHTKGSELDLSTAGSEGKANRGSELAAEENVMK